MDEFEITRATWGLCNISGLTEEQYDEIFFPVDDDTSGAKKFCDECELQAECLDYGTANLREGVWGGEVIVRQQSCSPPVAFSGETASWLLSFLSGLGNPHEGNTSSSAEQMATLVLRIGLCMNRGLAETEVRELFISGGAVSRAKSICLGCSLLEACAFDAGLRRVMYGVQGGMSKPDRKHAARNNGQLEFESSPHGKNIVELAIDTRNKLVSQSIQ